MERLTTLWAGERYPGEFDNLIFILNGLLSNLGFRTTGWVRQEISYHSRLDTNFFAKLPRFFISYLNGKPVEGAPAWYKCLDEEEKVCFYIKMVQLTKWNKVQFTLSKNHPLNLAEQFK